MRTHKARLQRDGEWITRNLWSLTSEELEEWLEYQTPQKLANIIAYLVIVIRQLYRQLDLLNDKVSRYKYPDTTGD